MIPLTHILAKLRPNLHKPNSYNYDEASLDKLIFEFKIALTDEIEELKKDSNGKKIYVKDGKLINKNPHKFTYLFHTEFSTQNIPEDSPCDILIKNQKYKAYIIKTTSNEIILELYQDFGHTIPFATIITNPWFIYEKLRENLLNLKSYFHLNLDKALKLFNIIPANLKPIPYPIDPTALQNSNLNQNQKEALTKALSQEITFIWGPPGTGKTKTIAEIMKEIIKTNKTILFTSHTNTAIDEALLKLIEILPDKKFIDKHKIIRYGTPVLNDNEFKKITFDEILAKKVGPLIERKKELEEKIEKLEASKQDPPLVKKLKEELNYIQEKINIASKEILDNCLLIGTTLSKIATDSSLFLRNFSTMILDEASMAPLPFVFWASCLATDKCIITGDFRQLPPIAKATTPHAQKWLKKDIFEQANIVQNYELGKPDTRLTKLTVQHRMHPQIAQLVNAKMYGNELKTHETTIQSTSKITNKEPFPNSPIILCDTSSINPWAMILQEYKSKSRINIFHAFLCCSLAKQALDKNTQSVGIITPYNAQARLIAALIHDLGLSEKVKVATVHRFQGGEEDIIIYDTVDSPPFSLGKFSWGTFPENGKTASETSKLLNVAITRAKGKFIMVANYSFLKQKLLYQNNALLYILNSIIQNGKIINPLNESFLFTPLTPTHQNPNKKENQKQPPSQNILSTLNFPLFQNLLPNETEKETQPEPNENLPLNEKQLWTDNSFQKQFLKSIFTAQEHIIVFSPNISENFLLQIEKHLSLLLNKGISIFLITKPPQYPQKITLEKFFKKLGIHLTYRDEKYCQPLALIDFKECWFGTFDLFTENRNKQGIMISIKFPKTISLLYHFFKLDSFLYPT